MKNKRIRIGYISDSFCGSPMLPLLVSFFGMHDAEEFEIYGYMTGRADELTKSFIAAADCWRDLSGMKDDVATEVICRDGLDILIDLSENGTFDGIFKDKPAAHCFTVFEIAETIDDVPYCMAYLPGMPIANTLPPFRKNGGVSFGIGGDIKRMSKQELSAVREILKYVPNSRLRVSVPVPDTSVAEPLLKAGIPAGSIELAVEDALNWEGLSTVDIMLSHDGMTSWELYMALYAGVPVMLSPSAQLWMHRLFASRGMEEWSASGFEEYVEKAVITGRKKKELEKTRLTLCAKLKSTGMMQARCFMNGWEHAIEKIVRGTETKAERLSFCSSNAKKRFQNGDYRSALRFAEEAYSIEQTEDIAYILGVSFWKNELLQEALDVAAEWLDDSERRNTLSVKQLHAWCDLRALTAGHAANEKTEEYLLERIEAAKKLSLEIRAGAYGQWLLSFNAKKVDEVELFEKHRGYQRLFSDTAHLPAVEKRAHKKLRVGYLSPNLNHHVMEYFIRPFFELYDRERFEIYGYNTGKIDDKTKELQEYTSGWKNLEGKTALEIARAIRDDDIDILVELGGHTSKSGLAALAYRPAPVQVSGLGYMATTGLLETDYFLTDSFIDPPGINDSFFTEKLLRLTSQLCYQPKENLPECTGAPCVKRGYIVFGIFNDYLKITDERLLVWKKIMELVPDSVLLFKSENYTVPEMALQTTSRLEHLGMDIGRVILEEASPDYMTRYLDVDIALDTYPYPGGATTCDALWMGVPVVTQYSTRHSSRFAYGILAEIGLPELGAETENGYIQRIVGLANDRELLDELHKNLRIMMKKSPLMDARGYAREVEEVYEKIWKDWLNTQK